MKTRKLTVSSLIITFLLMSGCASTIPKSSGYEPREHWASCAVKGGLTLGLPGAAYHLATGGAAFAAGAMISGTACAMASDQEQDSFYIPGLKNVETIHFTFNSAEISAGYERQLNELLKQVNSDHRIMITGHACDIGTREYNQHLSERRANVVKKWLMDRGIPSDHIETMGKGEDEPVRGNDTEKMRQENRRAQILLK